jgi:hypothetical protein
MDQNEMSNLYRGSSIDASYQDSYQFADDTQLFNKNDESVKKSFDILTIYEKQFFILSIIDFHISSFCIL